MAKVKKVSITVTYNPLKVLSVNPQDNVGESIVTGIILWPFDEDRVLLHYQINYFIINKKKNILLIF
jgi:hypothetical protein